MKKKILVYTDDRTATGSLIPSLRQSFPSPEFHIQTIGVDDIRNHVLKRTSSRTLVLPGIIGHESRYKHDLGPAELDEINIFIRRGNTLMAVCAGSYFVSTATIFHLTDGKPKKILINANPIFNGVAKGVHAEYAANGPVVVPVTFRAQSGEWKETGVCYDKSPLLYPKNRNDPDMEIMAFYHEIPKNPVAMLRLKFGEGAAYIVSMHVEIAHQEIPDQAHGNFSRSKSLMDKLKPHEPGRREMWEVLTARIKKDIERQSP